jgi:hypothetical protein
MPTFSRRMPAAHRPMTLMARIVHIALACGAIALFVSYPWLLAVWLGVGLVGHVLDRSRRARLRAFAAERPGESLCTFARAISRTERDGWVLRAVYEELKPHYRVGKLVVPPRPSDELRSDLEIDPEDLEDVIVTAARRAGRDAQHWEANPYRNRLHTVADLVGMISAQTRVAA